MRNRESAGKGLLHESIVDAIASFFSCGLVAAHAQQVIQVTAKMIQEHTDHRVFPVYPPIAKAAHVQGTVVFNLRIGTTGKIESMDVVSGSPMLRQAAIDALKQWAFHPFEKDGVPAIATGQYNIVFTLGDQSSSAVGQGPPSSVPPNSSTPVKTVTVRVLSDNAATGPDEELNQNSTMPTTLVKKVFGRSNSTIQRLRRARMRRNWPRSCKSMAIMSRNDPPSFMPRLLMEMSRTLRAPCHGRIRL